MIVLDSNSSATKEQLFVVTVNWNRPGDTCDCLDSLYQQIDTQFKVIVVDNGSTDDSVEVLQSLYPQIQLIKTPTNLGFAAGFNLGIRAALDQNATHILIINNDTLADPFMLQALLTSMDAENQGVVAPIIYYAQQPTKIWSAGGDIHPLLLEPRNSHSRDVRLSDTPVQRTFLSGCCLLVKRQIFEDVGLFDERFFLYYEDLDFCLRVSQKKWQMQVIPGAKLWHKVSLSSGGEQSPNERYYMALSSAIYFRKHLTWKNALIVILYRLGSAILWTLRLVNKNSWQAIRAYWHGLLIGWF